MPALLERFEGKYIPEPNSGCWLWIAGTSAGKWNYGLIWHDGMMRRAHHVSWRLFRGDIPKGKWVLHNCDAPSCVNPDHLWLGTHLDNMRDMHTKCRGGDCRNLGEDHGQAVLSEEDVVYIRKSSETQNKLAHRFGVRQATIWNVLNYKTWKHI
jgi:HNH endonuclease